MRTFQSVVLAAFLSVSLWALQSANAQPAGESNDFSYALKLYNEGFYDIAAQQFSVFINRYPKSDQLAEARFYLANSYFKLNNFENARIEYQSLAVGFPKSDRAPEAWYKVGECYQRLNQLEDAARAFETVKILYPENALAPGALIRASEILLTLGKIEDAQKGVQEFLDRYPDAPEYPQGRILYGKILAGKHQFQRATNEFKKALESARDPEGIAEAKWQLAKLDQTLGFNDRAIATLQEILDMRLSAETVFRISRSLARAYMAKGEFKSAIQFLSKQIPAISDRNRKNQLQLLLAQNYFLSGDYYSSEKSIENVLGQPLPDSLKLRANFYLAFSLLRSDKPREAIPILQKLVDAAATHPDTEYIEPALAMLVELHMREGNQVQAQTILRRLQERFKEDGIGEQLHIRLIRMLLKDNALSAALEELSRFSSLYPRSNFRDDLRFEIGRSFFKLGQFERASAYFQEVAEKFVCSEKSDSSLIYLRYLDQFASPTGGMAVNKLAHLIGRIVADEDKNQLRYELGVIYASDLKDYTEANQLFSMVLQSTADSSLVGKTYYYLSESLLKQHLQEAFFRQADTSGLTEAKDALQKAMPYIRFVPHADSLMFRFLKYAVPPDAVPLEKQIEFWQHFTAAYPTSSSLPFAKFRLARLFLEKGDTLSAKLHLKDILASRANNRAVGTAYWRLAEIYELQSDTAAALQTLKDFLLNVRQHPAHAKAYWKLALLTAGNGDYETAAKFLEKIVELYDYSQLSEKARILIPEYYIRARNFPRALAYMEPILKTMHHADLVVAQFYPGGIPEYYFYAGKAYYQQHDYAKARIAFFNYLNSSDSRRFRNETFYLLGIMAAEENDPELALMNFELVSQEDSVYFKATEKAADILFKLKRFPDAQKKFELLEASAGNPQKKMTYAARKIHALINQNQYKQASSQINQFKKTFGKSEHARDFLASFEFEFGKVSYETKNFNTAIKYFRSVLKSYKSSSYTDDATYYLGLCYTTLNKFKEAEKTFSDFLKSYPNSKLLGNVYISLGNLYFRSDQPDLALESFKKAVQYAEDPAAQMAAMTNLIRMYQNLGLWDGALKVARDYVAKYPDAADIIDKKILIGISLIQLNRFTEAVDFLRKLKYEASSEQEPEIQFYIGEAYFNGGQYEDAIREFVKIPLLSRQTKLQWEASALYYSGQAYEKMGRISDAIRMYQEIVERPGILVELKREARKRIDQLQNNN